MSPMLRDAGSSQLPFYIYTLLKLFAFVREQVLELNNSNIVIVLL